MKCYFDDNNEPKVDLVVAGSDRRAVVTAAIDTGFDGALMLSLPDALSMGLTLTGTLTVELADGSIKKELVFSGEVVMGEKAVPVDILLTTSSVSLLGTALLQDQRLTIDFPRRVVSITPSRNEKETSRKV